MKENSVMISQNKETTSPLGEWLKDDVNRLAFDRQVLEALLRHGNQSAVGMSIIVGSSTTEALDALKRLESKKAAKKVDNHQVLPHPKDKFWTAFQ